MHVIQWRKAFTDPDTRLPARVLTVGDTDLTVRCRGETYRLANHDLARARDLFAVHGPEVQLQRRWGVLWFGPHLISIRDADTGPLGPCQTEDGSHGWLVRPEHDDPPGDR